VDHIACIQIFTKDIVIRLMVNIFDALINSRSPPFKTEVFFDSALKGGASGLDA
jgi:hypothetical protein